MTYYVLIDTFDCSRRGRGNALDSSRDIGSVLSCHRTYEAAHKQSEKLNRDTKRANGRSAFVPTTVRESRHRIRPGTMVCEGDFEATEDVTLTTLATFKEAASAAAMNHFHRGPNDVRGYERAVEVATRIERARTWDQVIDAVEPLPEWPSAAANRCLPREL